MPEWIIGDLLTGERIQTVSVVSGRWSDTLNAAGDISCTVSLRSPDVALLGLRENAKPGKAFLAVVEDDLIMQAGPIWAHDYDADRGRLTLTGAGMWSYFDHRVLLPVLAPGVSPVDAAADTNLTSSLQGVARALVAQAQTATGGSVPVNLPTAIGGASVRNYRGSELARVGARLRELTEVEGGPDIRFVPRFTAERQAVQWDMIVGTPTKPLLFSAVEPTFTVGVPGSSVSELMVTANGSGVGSTAYAAGGRGTDKVLIGTATDQSLLLAGFPLLELVDTSRATVTLQSTLDAFAVELVLGSRREVQTWTFEHRLSERPFLSGFAVGDFAKVRVQDDLYLTDGEYRLRILSRSSDAEGRVVRLVFRPEVL